MNKAKGQILTGALVLGLVLLSTQTGFTQVAGRVTANGGGPLAAATVQIWDSYPNGTVLEHGLTDGGGAFNLANASAGAIDLRVFRSGYFPTVVRNIPNGTTNGLVDLKSSPAASGLTNERFCFVWDTTGTYAGGHLKEGDVVVATDPDGVDCGLVNLHGVGGFSVRVEGDLPGIPGDQGAETNDEIAFSINGLDAAVAPSPLLWQNQGTFERIITVDAGSVPGATIVGNLQALGQAGGSAFITYTLTNTGGTAETFDFTAENDNGWTMISTPTKATGVTLNPGEVSAIVVEVQIPGGTPDQTLEVRFSVAASTYGSANSGAFTTLEVSTVSDIWEGGGNGLLPSGFGLAQNYPNPFNPSTLISFNLEFAGHVRLDIVNILGQHVATLVDGFRPAGVTSLTWNASDDHGHVVPTGIYFYRLQQGELSQVRKMVLMK